MSKNLKRSLFLCSLAITSISEGMFRCKRDAFFKASRSKFTEADAKKIFPKNIPLELQIKFLKLFLYERVKMSNRKMMVRTFAENQLPYSVLHKMLSGKKVPHKRFINQMRNWGYDSDKATLIRIKLEEILDQITHDQDKHRRPADIYDETMAEIYPDKPLSVHKVATPFVPPSIDNFIDPNPFEALKELADS